MTIDRQCAEQPFARGLRGCISRRIAAYGGSLHAEDRHRSRSVIHLRTCTPKDRIFTCAGFMAGSVACVQIARLWRLVLACCASCPASTSRKKTRAVPWGGWTAAGLHRQPISRALTTPPAGTRKRSIAVQEPGRCGRADGSVVTGARRPRSRADPPAATSAPACRRCSARWCCVGTRARTGRLDQAAARPSGGPPDPARPAAPVTRTKRPLTRALLSVPGV
jgi:hypothetical protein